MMAAATTGEKKILKECLLGEKCYRKNPIHFSEFSHEHLDTIYENGRDPITNEYNIPDELDAEIVELQLRLLERLFPKKKAPSVWGESATTKLQTATISTASYTSPSNKPLALVDANEDTSLMIGYRLGYPGEFSVEVIVDNVNEYDDDRKSHDVIRNHSLVVFEPGQMAEKLEKAAPYNFFLTTVKRNPVTHVEPLAITFQELLDKSLGLIESSIHINFQINIKWLMYQYEFAGISKTPMLVIYSDDPESLRSIQLSQSHITTVRARSLSNTKMMFFNYKDKSMRIVITTANLVDDDWCNRTQGVWISPKLPKLEEGEFGESKTSFRHDLVYFLSEYQIPELQDIITHIMECDFRAINVFFVGSVPGCHRGEGSRSVEWGHLRLGGLLKNNSAVIDDNVPIICQTTNIGYVGDTVRNWFDSEFINSLRKDGKTIGTRVYPQIQLIYPTLRNVMNCYDGPKKGGECLTYNTTRNDKQKWLKAHLQQWSSNLRNRSRAMPGLNSYTRYSLDKNEGVYWFLMSSATLSKTAWGVHNRIANLPPYLKLSNFEAGVLFMPTFLTQTDTFPLGQDRDGIPAFPLPFDFTVTPYKSDDEPFLKDAVQNIVV